MLVNLARTKAISEVMLFLRREARLTVAEAKFLALHTTRIKGVCHRCYYPLAASSKSECPNCRALNLDW